MAIKLLISLVFACLFSTSIRAKDSFNRAVELDAELSHTVITDIIQDDKGYLWIGTIAGLNRFDGYEVTQMYQQNFNLSYDHITALETDTLGNVWIGTESGLNVYRQDSGKIEVFYSNAADPLTLKSNRILSLAAGKDGDMWVGTSKGISYFQAEQGNFKNHDLLNPLDIPFVNQEITAILVTEGDVFAGTSKGEIVKLNQKGEFKQIDSEIELKQVKQFGYASGSEIYILGESELFKFDVKSSRMVLVDKNKIGINDPFVTFESLRVSGKNSLWLGTENKGLYKVDLSTSTSEHFFSIDRRDGQFGVSKVNHVFEDRTGTIWIGSDANLYRLSLSNIQFQHYNQDSDSKMRLSGNSVFSMLVDNDGWYWFGTEFDGINVFKPSNYNGFEHDPSIQLPKLNSTSINSIVDGASNKVWILAADKVWLFDKKTSEFSSINNSRLDEPTLYSAKYHNGKLWISSDLGLWSLDENGNLKQYLVSQQIFNLQNKILAFDLDKERNQIWLATEMGVVLFNIETEDFTALTEMIPNSPSGLSGVIYDLHLDLHGRLWIGTYQYGLYKVDFVTQQVEVLNHGNSLLNNVIYAIQEDSNRILWLATARGLFRLDPSNNHITQFGTAQGQPIRDFNLGAKALDGNKLLLAGINGAIHFNPEAYKEDENQAKPLITDILIGGQPPRIGNNAKDHASYSVSSLEELVLFYDDASLSLSFSGMHYANPRSNRFKYRLTGFDDDWTEVDSSGRRAIYPKLESGNYKFELLASNKDGIWSAESKVINITVQPSPFWSKWALVAYGIVLAGITFIISLLYRARHNERRAANQKLSESEERLKLSLWGSGDELWDWNLKSGALHLSNEWDIDFPRDGIRSGHSDANSNIHPYDLPFVKQALQAHISRKSKHFESTYRISDQKGGWIWVLDQGKIVEFDGERASRMAGTLKNVTEIKSTEQQLSVIAKSFENISDGVWILDDSLKYIAINKAFESITGYSEEEVIGAPMQENAIKNMSESFYKRLMQLLNDKGSWQGELEAIKSDGSVYPIDINIDVVRNNEGQVTNYVGVFSDITYRKIAEKELRRLATTDQLTRLANRNTFRSEVEIVLQNSGIGKEHALLFIDLDNFKRINDSLGHSVGDELLITVADKLRDVMNDSKGLVGRLGGDEFIIFMEHVDTWHQPATIAQSVLDVFKEKLELSTHEVQVSPSIGVVMSPKNGNTADELLKNADTAMYYAKKKGKNTFQFYTQQMNEQAQMRLNLENDLRIAIERDEFVVFYQPKVNLETGKIDGFESLVRWRSEDRGLVMPNEFIPLAEETGLIVPISQHVIEKSCIQVRDWQKRGLFSGKMAINLSAVQFYHENLWETVKNALHLANLDASSVEFEITEGMVMQDLAHSIQQMNTLKEMGVSLALDDFGVGYSSLGNLKDFPIDTLKIDRSFIWDLDDSDRDKKLVASIITLAHNLDIKVVAEGVETIKQVEALKEMKCEEIQGFIYSRPLPAFEIEKLLEDPEATLERALKEASE